MYVNDEYRSYILGDAKSLEKITKEELSKVKKKVGDPLYIWRDCFVKTLINNSMSIQSFGELYLQFKEGNKQPILALGILPDRLLKNKRLALIYIEALMYVAFKRDLTTMYKQKTLLTLGYP